MKPRTTDTFNLCVIPARGGSKRIPRKNIRSFCGKPMIAWSIEAALSAGVFDAVLVSTDDDEIATIAESYGAEVPFRRPPELSDDYVATLPVIAHAIQWWKQNRGDVDYACCIYATAPFIKSEFLRKGLEVLHNKPDAEFSIGVTSFAFPIFRALQLTASGEVTMIWPENEIRRSQDFPEALHETGQFFWGKGKVDAWFDELPFYAHSVIPIVVPRWLSHDIDTMEDWIHAEFAFAAQKRFEQSESYFSS